MMKNQSNNKQKNIKKCILILNEMKTMISSTKLLMFKKIAYQKKELIIKDLHSYKIQHIKLAKYQKNVI